MREDINIGRLTKLSIERSRDGSLLTITANFGDIFIEVKASPKKGIKPHTLEAINTRIKYWTNYFFEDHITPGTIN